VTHTGRIETKKAFLKKKKKHLTRERLGAGFEIYLIEKKVAFWASLDCY
jgi:hypothetical protein